jgi:transcriptional antiterminator NusG
MAEKNLENGSGRARLKRGVLPGVREIRRPDFSSRAADIEKAEAERVLKQGEVFDADAADQAAVAESLAAQAAGGEEEQLDESAITDEPKWYVAHTYSGYENKVKINIQKTIENRHLENQIFEVRVPMQDVVEVKNGVKKAVPKKMFPGYVLVNMIMNDDTWYVVRNTRGVTGFVGPGSKPVPLTETEMKSLGIRPKNITVDFEVGDMVAVVAGVWKDTVGVVQKINYNKQSATINVDLFGRETSVEISFAEVRRAN